MAMEVEGLKRGLTLGKYAPLHRGHQLVIETALSEMDETIFINYFAPDSTNIPIPFAQDGFAFFTRPSQLLRLGTVQPRLAIPGTYVGARTLRD